MEARACSESEATEKKRKKKGKGEQNISPKLKSKHIFPPSQTRFLDRSKVRS
jgi:hypothetical protein